MLTTDQKGAIGETAVVHTATKLGLGVYRAVSDGARYDLIIDTGTSLLRVQCKWAPRHGDVVVVLLVAANKDRHPTPHLHG